MQPYTPAVKTLVTAKNVEVSFGADLLDADDALIEDLTEQMVDGSVGRNNYADIHGTCDISMSRKLDWSSARIRLFQILSAGDVATDVVIVDRPSRVESDTDKTDARWADATLTNLRTAGDLLQLAYL